MAGAARVIAVGHNRRNLELIAELLSGAGYPTATAATLEELDRTLEAEVNVELVLIDIGGFDRAVWDRAERLRGQGIPFLVISPGRDVRAEEEGMAHGASSVVSKPLGRNELLAIVRGMIGER